MTYNQERHIQLLKRDQDLKNQGKNLYFENREEDFELCNYNVAMEEHIFWQDRYQVALSMEDFLNKEIDGEELYGRVYGFRRKLKNECEKFKLKLTSVSEKIKAFQPDERAKKLSDFLTTLYCECKHFSDDYENGEFYTSIKNLFLNFRKVLNEE